MPTLRTLCALMLPLAAAACSFRQAPAPQMSDERLVAVLDQHAESIKRGQGVVELVFDEVEMVCIYDTHHDRMRIVAPVAREHAISSDHLRASMMANFHTALDARYAIGGGVVYAAFLHPLSSLSEAELLSALRQVAALAKTFGTTYSSGELVFPGGRSQPTPSPAPDA